MFTDHVQSFGVKFSAGGFIAALTHGESMRNIEVDPRTQQHMRTSRASHDWHKFERNSADLCSETVKNGCATIHHGVLDLVEALHVVL
jgi:hypothetical protein